MEQNKNKIKEGEFNELKVTGDLYMLQRNKT